MGREKPVIDSAKELPEKQKNGEVQPQRNWEKNLLEDEDVGRENGCTDKMRREQRECLLDWESRGVWQL